MKCLRAAGIAARHAPGLRTALLIADDDGFIFTPTALYLEAEPEGQRAPNAMRLSSQQLAEALARLSPVAKMIAVAQAPTDEERERIASLPVEVGTAPVTDGRFERVAQALKALSSPTARTAADSACSSLRISSGASRVVGLVPWGSCVP